MLRKSFGWFPRGMIASMGARHAMLLGAILLLSANLRAQTEVQADWINSTPVGFYSVATNWSTGTVPNNNSLFVYNVAIDQGEVRSDQNATINALTIGFDGKLSGGVPVSAATLSAGTMLNEGSVVYAGPVGVGILNISGELINSGQFIILHNTAEVGDTYNSGVLETGGPIAFLDGAIEVNGTLTNTGAVNVIKRLFVNGDFINSGAVTINNTNFQSATRISGNLFNNENGTFSFGGDDTIFGDVQNDGTMVADDHRRGPIIGNLDNHGLFQMPRYGNVTSAKAISNCGGTVTVAGYILADSFLQDSAGTWEVKKNTRGDFGHMTLTDSIFLDGVLDLSLLAAEPLVLGQSFNLATFPPGNLDGSFAFIVGNSFSNDTLMFQINYDEDAGRIRLTVVPAGSQEVIFTPQSSGTNSAS